MSVARGEELYWPLVVLRGSLAAAAVLLSACGPARHPAPAAWNVSVPAARTEPEPQPDLSPVAAPDTVVAVARIELEQLASLPKEVRALLDSLRRRIPARVRTLQALAPEDATLEAAVAVDFLAPGRPEPTFAFSLGLPSLQVALDALGHGARRVRPGVYRLAEPRCVVAASRGPQPARLVCSPLGLDELLPYMTRGLPEEPLEGATLAQVELRVRPAVERYAGTLDQLRSFGSVLVRALETGDVKLDAPLSRVVFGLMEEGVSLCRDLDRMTLAIRRSSTGDGVEIGTRTHFGSTQSFTARLPRTLAESSALPPKDFWQLPGDASSAMYVHLPPKDTFSGLGELGAELVDAALETAGADRRAQARGARLARALFGYGGTFAHAAGVFAEEHSHGESCRSPQATARGEQAAKGARDPNASAGPWQLAVLDLEPAEVVGLVDDAASVLRAVTKQELLSSRVLQGILDAARRGDDLGLPTIARRNSGPHRRLKGARAFDWKFPAAPGATTPNAGVLLVVPRDGRTWIAVGKSESALADKLAKLFSGNAATLEAGSALAPLRRARGFSGGFLTLAGMLAAARDDIHDAASGEHAAWLEHLKLAPHRGEAPILSYGRTQVGPIVELVLAVPDAALVDLAYLAEHAGAGVEPRDRRLLDPEDCEPSEREP